MAFNQNDSQPPIFDENPFNDPDENEDSGLFSDNNMKMQDNDDNNPLENDQ